MVLVISRPRRWIFFLFFLLLSVFLLSSSVFLLLSSFSSSSSLSPTINRGEKIWIEWRKEYMISINKKKTIERGKGFRVGYILVSFLLLFLTLFRAPCSCVCVCVRLISSFLSPCCFVAFLGDEFSSVDERVFKIWCNARGVACYEVYRTRDCGEPSPVAPIKIPIPYIWSDFIHLHEDWGDRECAFCGDEGRRRAGRHVDAGGGRRVSGTVP
mgnify:CR=1 FL=1